MGRERNRLWRGEHGWRRGTLTISNPGREGQGTGRAVPHGLSQGSYWRPISHLLLGCPKCRITLPGVRPHWSEDRTNKAQSSRCATTATVATEIHLTAHVYGRPPSELALMSWRASEPCATSTSITASVSSPPSSRVHEHR